MAYLKKVLFLPKGVPQLGKYLTASYRRRNKSERTRKRAICKRKVHKNHATSVLHKIQKNGTQNKHQSLCVKTQSSGDRIESEQYSKITPDMIVDSLHELSYWRDPIKFSFILKYIKDHFTVNPNLTELEIELRQKLHVAEKAGIVKGDATDKWRLCTSMERLRHIPETLVSLFWQLHCDTLNPLADKIKRKPPIGIIIVRDKQDSDSDLPSDG